MINTKKITPQMEEAFKKTKKTSGEESVKKVSNDIEIQQTLMKLDNMKISVSNELVLGAQPFQSTLEAKLLRIVLSQVYSRNSLDSNSYIAYTAKVGEIAKKLFPGKSHFRKSIYNDIKKTAIALQSRVFYIQDSKTGRFSARNWTIGTDGSGYEKGTLSIILNPLLYPYLTQLDRNFSIFSLDVLLDFKSKYTMRIYEGLYVKIHRDKKLNRQFSTGASIEVQFQIDEFRIVSSTVGMYKNIKDLKKKCIEPSVLEITEKTEMNIIDVDYQARSGRSTDTILFHICQNQEIAELSDAKTYEIIDKQHIFDNSAELTLGYIEDVFQEFGLLDKCKKALPKLLKQYLKYGEFASSFNNDFNSAYKNAKNDIVKYIEKMIENRHNNGADDSTFNSAFALLEDDGKDSVKKSRVKKKRKTTTKVVEVADYEEEKKEVKEENRIQEDHVAPELINLLREDAQIDTIYITKIFNAASCYYDMNELLKVLQLYENNTALFNENVRKAVSNADQNIVKYVIAAGENKKKSSAAPRVQKDHWLNEKFEKAYQEILDYWESKSLQMQTEQEAAGADSYILKPIRRTDIRHKRFVHSLFEDGESVDSIVEAIDVASTSAFFLRTQGSFNFFINPKNYYDIAAGERDYDSEEAAIWKINH